MSGTSTDLEDAVRIATSRAVQDNRFGFPILDCEAEHVSLELWILTESAPFDPDREKFDVGVDGVEVSSGKYFAYYKPSVAITSSFETAKILAEKVCIKAGIPSDDMVDAKPAFRRTRWLHFLQMPGSNSVRMEALRPLFEDELCPASVTEAVTSATDHMMNVQLATGTFLYKLDLITGLGSEYDRKLVRTAGCTYSLAWVADHFRGTHLGDRAEAACRRAIRYLCSRIEPFEGGGYVAYVDSSEGALGATALLARALQFEPFRKEFQAERRGLCQTLRRFHRPDGSFRCYVDNDSDSDNAQDYYPGEALLVLAAEEEAAPQASSIQAAFSHSLQYYRERFSASPQSAYVLWHGDCWRRIAALASGGGEREFARECREFVMALAEYILQRQLGNKDGAVPRYVGGFASQGRPAASSLAYAEGLVNAVLVARASGQRDTAERYLRAAEAALQFGLRLQVKPCQTPFFKVAARLATGAVTMTLSAFQFRADNNQHLITLGLRYLESCRQSCDNEIYQ